jgi:hypothetical protein
MQQRMQTTFTLAAISFVMGCAVASEVGAASQATRSGTDPAFTARRACEDAVTPHIRNMLPWAKHVGFSDPRVRQLSESDTRLSGRGSTGRRRFTYVCTFSTRDNSTSDVTVRVR